MLRLGDQRGGTVAKKRHTKQSRGERYPYVLGRKCNREYSRQRKSDLMIVGAISGREGLQRGTGKGCNPILGEKMSLEREEGASKSKTQEGDGFYERKIQQNNRWKLLRDR